MLGRGLQRLQIEGSCGESSRSRSLYARELTLLQIPGWSEASEPMQAHGCEQQCTHALPHSVGEQPEPWANRSDFIDAALHEELIWMEAAAACDACAQVNNCKAHVAKLTLPIATHRALWLMARAAQLAAMWTIGTLATSRLKLPSWSSSSSSSSSSSRHLLKRRGCHRPCDCSRHLFLRCILSDRVRRTGKMLVHCCKAQEAVSNHKNSASKSWQIQNNTNTRQAEVFYTFQKAVIGAGLVALRMYMLGYTLRQRVVKEVIFLVPSHHRW
jgi:hypothetical protein